MRKSAVSWQSLILELMLVHEFERGLGVGRTVRRTGGAQENEDVVRLALDLPVFPGSGQGLTGLSCDIEQKTSLFTAMDRVAALLLDAEGVGECRAVAQGSETDVGESVRSSG